MYKRSFYNHYSTIIAGKVAVINLLSGAVVLLEKDMGKHLIDDDLSEIPLYLLIELEQKGIVFQDNNEEKLVTTLKAARSETKQKEFDKKTHFYIIPTLKCNLCCDYCYLQNYKSDHALLNKGEMDAILKNISLYRGYGFRVTL